MRLKNSLEKIPPKNLQTQDEGLLFAQGNQEAINLTCQAIGQIIEGWGFKKIMGVIWAFLYLCP